MTTLTRTGAGRNEDCFPLPFWIAVLIIVNKVLSQNRESNRAKSAGKTI